jgi:N-formylglutamate amidohydrolase
LQASALQQESNLLTDWFTDEIFGGLAGASDVIFPVSRLVVDPERFENDEQEPMAGRGMGVVYEKTSSQAPLRYKLSVGERQALIDDYYRPHHQALSDLTGKMIAGHGRCFILDGHSFPLVPLPFEVEQSLVRPEICIGTDAYHTPASLRDAAVELFKEAGFTTAVNHPFAGAMVAQGFYQTDKRVVALMIEVRRDLYMDETNIEKLAVFDTVRQRIRNVISKITILQI